MDSYTKRDGKTVVIHQMTDEHLDNAIRYFSTYPANGPPGLHGVLLHERTKRQTQYQNIRTRQEAKAIRFGELGGMTPAKLIDAWQKKLDEEPPSYFKRNAIQTVGGDGRPLTVAIRTAGEIAELVNENERLKKRVAMLETERGPGLKAPRPIETCSIGADWED